MSNELTTVVNPAAGALAVTAAKVNEYVRASKASNTRRAYTADWQHFFTWCTARGLASLPADPLTVALYLADHAADLKVSTLARRLTTISQAHQHAGHESPTKHKTVVNTWQGIKRTRGIARTGKAPTLAADVRRMVAGLTTGPKATRDRALILLGFAGAFRRSELVALNVENLAFVHEGLEVTLQRSKTDQEAQGTIKAIAYAPDPAVCPVRAVRAWLDLSQRSAGPIFTAVNKAGHIGAERLSDKAIARLVKTLAAAAGLDPADYSGHSLRAGHVTTAYNAGADENAIATITGHKSVTVLRQYDRRTRWVKNSSTRIWS